MFFTLYLALASFNISSGPQVQKAQADLAMAYGPITAEVCQNPKLRNFDLVSLKNFKLNKNLYIQTSAALNDAARSNIKLSLESAFRPCSEQQSLRKQNCPAADSPAASCSPATEKAGDSLHNYGMAVDFKCEGYQVFANSPCYPWLQQNSPKYGFKQRPTEPWHWSLTGQ
jgi:D-alanyl-D-alanine carboxypeptidase